MNAQVYDAVEDAVFRGECQFAYINAQLVGNHARNLVDQSSTVDSAKSYSSIKEQFLVHIPFDIKNTIAITGFQLVGYGTSTFVNLYAVAVIDIAQRVITRNWVTAIWEEILVDVLLVDVYGLLSVKLLRNDKQFLLFLFTNVIMIG